MAIRDKNIIFFVLASALFVFFAASVSAVAPNISSVVMNATDNPNNTSNANLTAYVTASDAEGDNISYAWDWRKENVSIAILNMNFDVNDSAGTNKTKDYTTYSNNGTLGNGTAGTEPTWNATGGWNGTGAYKFDGSNDFIDITDTDFYDNTNISIELWIKPASVTGKKTLITSGSSGGDPWFHFVMDTTNIQAFAGGGYTAITAGLEAGVWQHLVFTIGSGTTGAGTVYKNGASIGSFNRNTASGTIVSIGKHKPGYTHSGWYKGSMDNIRIYNRELSAAQVLALYNNRSDLMVSDEISKGDNWSVCVTPNDGTADGSEACSNTLEVQNGAPIVSSVVLNATNKPSNTTSANLTAYVTAADNDGDNISYAWDWRKENVSIAVLNMNFDVNDSAGTNKTKDYTTYSNNGTLGNGTAGTKPRWNATAGRNGTGAYVFDGVDDVIVINDSDTLSFGNGSSDSPFSISGWFSLSSLPSSWALVSKGSGLYGGEYYLSVEYFRFPGQISFYVLDQSTSKRIQAYKWGLSIGKWMHVVATYDGSGTTSGINLYVDGTSAGTAKSKEDGYIAMENTNEPVAIGRRDDYINGTIDEVRIWNRSLSATEVLALYNNRSDLIVSNETLVGENWSVCVTPNDGTADGSEACSNTLTIMGDCETSADCAGGKSCLYNYCFSDSGIFTLQNGTQDVAWIDNYGRMMIAGTSSTSQGSCTGEFPIQASGSTVGAISKQGDLCLEGTMSESQSLPLASPAGGGFLVKNATSANVLYVDTSGNMALGADLIPNGFV